MQNSRDRILTTHVGSLPRPDDLIELNRAYAAGESHDEAALRTRRASAVAEIVRQQCASGIDIPNDGEFGKATEHRINRHLAGGRGLPVAGGRCIRQIADADLVEA